jgi:lipopolysaccharide transport system ATP-binding protein
VEPATVEIEYKLSAPITGLRIGVYLFTTRGEYIFTSFDTDEPEYYDRFSVRPSGHFVSRCLIPADTLNEGRYVLGINASSYRVKRYFQDEQALTLNVDASGSPGMQWLEQRFGPIRPRLNWKIEKLRV